MSVYISNLQVLHVVSLLYMQLRELPWFHDQGIGTERFVYHYVDFATMEAKTDARKYKYLEQFYADARTILHNVFVCFGGKLFSSVWFSLCSVCT